ncbi:hypothetical protein BXZ70DRAFT_930224 [Cristinia sonorae]|uniref:Fungal-type protein kinase domain-containing protein n=1 Tax=Cristinia sonorae TaxID=1940300 RepID=A0A8K0US95_9AGAR|nr:hypothetical protein BXZ70DRAFT_930224 [Cristinia sonorae]
MTDFWVGAISASLFLTEFMTPANGATAPDDVLDAVTFENVPQESQAGVTERDLYKPLVEAFNGQGILSDRIRFFNTSTKKEDKTKLMPDITCFKSLPFGPQEQNWKWYRLLIWVEVKLLKRYEAFITNFDPTKLLPHDSALSRETQGQLASYAAAQLARQHRLSLLSLFICGDYARFMRWDRSGVIVTERVNYREQPRLLAEFLWRFDQLDDHELGFDPTARPATEDEKKLLRDAITEHQNDETKRKHPDLHKALDEAGDYPFYSISVIPTASESDPTPTARRYIVKAPIHPPESPVGRATRAYYGVDADTKELVCLKDYWRPVDNARPSESDIYARLMSHNVPHLATAYVASDVMHNGALQETLTHRWLEEYKEKVAAGVAGYRPLCRTGNLRTYRHHRLVQELLYPLTSAINSKELVTAIHNALECIIAAKKADVLHRDVSAGNVMLNKNGQGVLNDWDHAIMLNVVRVSASRRTGTWQFMSIALGRNPLKIHDILDDVESCFWVLLYQAIHHMPCPNTSGKHLKMFNEFDLNPVGGVLLETGGKGKRSYLSDPFELVQFECMLLTTLIGKLSSHFEHYYHYLAQQVYGTADVNRNPEKEDPPKVLAIFRDALGLEGWPERDALPDQYPPVTKNAQKSTQVKAHRESLVTGAGTRELGRPRTTHTRDLDVAPMINLQPISAAFRNTASEDAPSLKRAAEEDVDGEGDVFGPVTEAAQVQETRAAKRPRTQSGAPPGVTFDLSIASGSNDPTPARRASLHRVSSREKLL